MKLFNLNVKTYEVEWEESVLVLAPFKALFDRDKSKHKDRATKELSYIWFFGDMKSDYKQELDEELRSEDIIRDLKLPKNWKPDNLVKEAIEFYKKRSRTVTSRLLEDAYLAVSKISAYLRDINLDETTTDARGIVRPKHDVKKVADTIKLIPQLLEALLAAEKAYLKEQSDIEGKSKGSRTFNTFEGL